MAIFWGAPPPPADGIIPTGFATSTGTLAAPHTAAHGDIYVQGTSGQLVFRRNSSPTAPLWDQFTLDETRGDTLIIGGQVNDRITKLGNQPFRSNWQNSAVGVIQVWNQITALDVWNVAHNLTAGALDVTVIIPGYSATIATQGRIEAPTSPPPGAQTIIVPDVTFTGPNNMNLLFAEAVAGSAIVRR